MDLNLLWLSAQVGEIDAMFRRGPRAELAERLGAMADGLPAGIPTQGLRYAAALAGEGTILNAWDEYNRALVDLAPAIRQTHGVGDINLFGESGIPVTRPADAD